MDVQTLITFLKEVGYPVGLAIALIVLLFKALDAVKEWQKSNAENLKQQNNLLVSVASDNTRAIDRLIQRLDETNKSDTLRDDKHLKALETLTGTVLQVDSRIGQNTATLEAVRDITTATQTAVKEAVPSINDSLDAHIQQLNTALKGVEANLGKRIDDKADDTQAKIARTIVETVEPVAKVLDSARLELENLSKVTTSVNAGVAAMQTVSETLTARLGGTIDMLTQWVVTISKPSSAAALSNGEKSNVAGS